MAGRAEPCPQRRIAGQRHQGARRRIDIARAHQDALLAVAHQVPAADRIGGDAVYVMDLRTHNEALRERFANRQWYRFEVPRDHPDSNPVLIPYVPPDSTARRVPRK